MSVAAQSNIQKQTSLGCDWMVQNKAKSSSTHTVICMLPQTTPVHQDFEHASKTGRAPGERHNEKVMGIKKAGSALHDYMLKSCG